MILTSWDDGHPLDMRIAELLAKYGLSGTFFVPKTNREGRPTLADANVRALDASFEVGGHTMSHQYLRHLAPEEMRHEIDEGKAVLEQVLGHQIRGFCYPGGVFDSHVVSLVQNAGFAYGRTTENLRSDLGTDPWTIPTTIQFYPHSSFVLAKNLLRFPAVSKLGIVRRRLGAPDFLSFLARVAEDCVNDGRVFHLWGHSWEIEAHNLWKPLDDFLRRLGGLGVPSMTIESAVCTLLKHRVVEVNPEVWK